MRSFSPQIIKHYLPLEFSKQVVDYHPSPLKAVPPSEDNPLTNIVLRNLQKRNKREFVLTFTNKTHSQFKAKKQLTYHNLFQQLEGGQQKLQLMKRELLNYQEKEDYVKNRANVFQKQKPNNKNREIFTSKQHRNHHKNSSNSRNISSAKSTNLYPQKRLAHRIYSSRNFVQGKTVSRDNYPMTPKTARTRIEYDTFASSRSAKDLNTLRIKGSKAPEAEMVDHWKKASVDASGVFTRSSR